MNKLQKIAFIHNKAREHAAAVNEKISWSYHAVQKLRQENLRKSKIEEALKDSVLIEDYEVTGRPLPDCLVLGFFDGIPVHIVVALDRALDRILIVTVYKPSIGRWENGWKKRKK